MGGPLRDEVGPEAALPVMEGKAALFKKFAGIDAFPICIRSAEPSEIVATVKAIAPSFGAVNLEDISAPSCFEVEAGTTSIRRSGGWRRTATAGP